MTRLTRRRLLQAGLAAPPYLLLGCSGDESDSADRESPSSSDRSRTSATPTPSCGHETEAQTEGPFWTPESPRRRSLVEQGMEGTRLILAGVVMDAKCRPIKGAILDFWQADTGGAYDNQGFTLRGHQRSDGDGRYRLETIVPGSYSGRTRHIHVKVARSGADVLTTQLYFPGVARNESDGIFDEDLLVERWRKRGGKRHASFDFVLT